MKGKGFMVLSLCLFSKAPLDLSAVYRVRTLPLKDKHSNVKYFLVRFPGICVREMIQRKRKYRRIDNE